VDGDAGALSTRDKEFSHVPSAPEVCPNLDCSYAGLVSPAARLLADETCMSAAFWVSSTWAVGGSVGGGSCGNGVNVLDGGGLLSDLLACCLFLSYSGRYVRSGGSLNFLRRIRTRALARADFAFLSSASDIWEAEVVEGGGKPGEPPTPIGNFVTGCGTRWAGTRHGPNKPRSSREEQ